MAVLLYRHIDLEMSEGIPQDKKGLLVHEEVLPVLSEWCQISGAIRDSKERNAEIRALWL